MAKFKVAFYGLLTGISDKSILLQWVLAIVAMVFCLLIGINYIEMIIVIICISLVIGFEYINTAIERLCDLISLDKDQRIKYIKDIAAAAVLIQALCSLIVMIIILINLFGR